MRVLRVNVGTARPVQIGGRTVMTAIAKQPQSGPVAIGPMGLAGDEQADPSVHGGLSKAVYAYPSEHLAFWRTVRAQARVAGWDAEVPPGLVGENLTLEGLTERQLWIGDRLHLPERDGQRAVLVVSEELDELFEIRDRLHVIAKGRLSPSIDRADATVERIGEWMSGLWDDAAHHHNKNEESAHAAA